MKKVHRDALINGVEDINVKQFPYFAKINYVKQTRLIEHWLSGSNTCSVAITLEQHTYVRDIDLMLGFNLPKRILEVVLIWSSSPMSGSTQSQPGCRLDPSPISGIDSTVECFVSKACTCCCSHRSHGWLGYGLLLTWYRSFFFSMRYEEFLGGFFPSFTVAKVVVLHVFMYMYACTCIQKHGNGWSCFVCSEMREGKSVAIIGSKSIILCQILFP